MMESLNLHTLVNSLPTAQHNAEELTNNFRAAALSITTLYRSSRKNSKRAYNAGYAAACQDLLGMIQQGVSSSQGGGGVEIGRVMDWIEARVEAIKAREEEEDEEDERDGQKDKEKNRPAPPKKVVARSKNQPLPLPTPNSPRTQPQSQPHSSPSPPSPSPPPAALRPIQRPTRSGSSPLPLPEIPITGAGVKRRHAMMMMFDPSSSPAADPPMGSAMTAGGSGRRRTRGARHQQIQNQNINQSGMQSLADAMDVEEDGRERKRVARR